MSNNQSPEEQAQAQLAKQKELAAHFTRLFSTSDGMVVLGELNSKFLINIVGPNQDHAYHLAQKDLMAYILANIKEGAA